MRSLLVEYVLLFNSFGLKPTLPVTASIIARNPPFFKKLQDTTRVEFAIHGFRHIDYSDINQVQFIRHVNKAIHIFQKQGIYFSGHRFPFLCRDMEKKALLHELGFRWDSSESVACHFPRIQNVSKQRLNAYEQILNSYQVSHYCKSFALPRLNNGIIEIPVTLPDDDILVDRLGLPSSQFSSIFQKMFKEVEENGELLVLQLHPERFARYRKPVIQFLNSIKNHKRLWKTSMDDIASWWQEKNGFQFNILEMKKNHYSISTRCTDRASILIKNNDKIASSKSFWKSWKKIDRKKWEMICPRKPAIGVHPKLAEWVIPFLQKEGYFFEVSLHPENYSVALEPKTMSDRVNIEKHIYKEIDRTSFPLIRFWKWPEEKTCGLVISGDVDALDVWDYFTRYYD